MHTSCWLTIFLLTLTASLSPAAAEQDSPLLTPKPGPAPHINAPQVYGVRPAHPFVYRIPCTGQRPMQFTAEALPAGLELDRTTGIVTGTTPPQPGRYPVTFTARNGRGVNRHTWTLVVGDQLALTPFMGWNDWYTHYDRITDKLVRQAADTMIESGMADFGYGFVNIDDCWMRKPGSTDPDLAGDPRATNGNILPNRRFPDMKALTGYIHSKGLRTGIYTSPGPLTCGRFEGSYGHEEADATQFAAWGFDFLKYDYCSYSRINKERDPASLQVPYRKMGELLSKLDRDVIFNLCQYGLGDVWNWAAAVGGNAWRTTGDLGVAKATALPGFYSIAFENAKHSANAGPGHWNDPDYLLIGTFGDARNMGTPQKTKLTAHEQYSYMSLWAMMASPLIFSGDMGQLDPFTLNILCNHEVIAVDQDSLGLQARILRSTGDEFILERGLSDGSLAVALFNTAEEPKRLSIDWASLGISGKWRVHDLWRQKDIGPANGQVASDVARHGVALFKLTPAP